MTKVPSAPNSAVARKAPRRKLGEVALVLRVPKEAVAYIDSRAGGKPRTAFVRDVPRSARSALRHRIRPHSGRERPPAPRIRRPSAGGPIH